MASENVKQFTDANFDMEVLGSPTPVLVDFWAEWCTPCKMLAPTIDALAAEMSGKVKVGKVDIDSNRAIAVRYDITAIPTVIIFSGGKPVKKYTGLRRKDELAAALAELVA
jgi:thioredoxin 1